MQGEPPARRRRLRGKQVDHRNHSADDPVADRGHGELENEGANQNDGDIGVKPEGITMAQWGVLRKLHLNLGHPTASLKRRLRTYGVSQHVLDAVVQLHADIVKSYDVLQQPELQHLPLRQSSTRMCLWTSLRSNSAMGRKCFR